VTDGLLNTALYAEKLNPRGRYKMPLCLISKDGSLIDANNTYNKGYAVIITNAIIRTILKLSKILSPRVRFIAICPPLYLP
jgi:hypothetical protein